MQGAAERRRHRRHHRWACGREQRWGGGGAVGSRQEGSTRACLRRSRHARPGKHRLRASTQAALQPRTIICPIENQLENRCASLACADYASAVALDPERLERLQHQAAAMGALRHENVVQVPRRRRRPPRQLPACLWLPVRSRGQPCVRRPAACSRLRYCPTHAHCSPPLFLPILHTLPQFMGVTMPPGPVCIVTEYLSRGSLADVLAAARAAPDTLPWPLRLELAVGAATGKLWMPVPGCVCGCAYMGLACIQPHSVACAPPAACSSGSPHSSRRPAVPARRHAAGGARWAEGQQRPRGRALAGQGCGFRHRVRKRSGKRQGIEELRAPREGEGRSSSACLNGEGVGPRALTPSCSPPPLGRPCCACALLQQRDARPLGAELPRRDGRCPLAGALCCAALRCGSHAAPSACCRLLQRARRPGPCARQPLPTTLNSARRPAWVHSGLAVPAPAATREGARLPPLPPPQPPAAFLPLLQAPDVLSGEGASPTSDVYAFALILWSLLTLQEPWAGTSGFSIVSLVQNGGRPEVPAPEAVPGGAFEGAARAGGGAGLESMPLNAAPCLPRMACMATDHLPARSAGAPGQVTLRPPVSLPAGLVAYVALMRRCWSQNKFDRPAFAEILPELR